MDVMIFCAILQHAHKMGFCLKSRTARVSTGNADTLYIVTADTVYFIYLFISFPFSFFFLHFTTNFCTRCSSLETSAIDLKLKHVCSIVSIPDSVLLLGNVTEKKITAGFLR